MPAFPPLRTLLAFAAVARTGSIQAAAAELNVTQPAVSQAVRQLESHVGADLLDRSRRPARPTEAGQMLAEALAEGLGRIDSCLAHIRRTGTQGGRTVTVACSIGVATYWLMPRLAAFYQTDPDLTVNVITTQMGAPDLAEGVDLSIRYGHGRWSDGQVRRLFAETVEPLCLPALRERFAGPVPPEAVPLLHVHSAEQSWVTWRDYLRRTGQPAIAARGQAFTNYVQATQAALEGHGLILGWRSITGALAAAGQLVTAGLPRLAPRDAFYLVARHKRGNDAAERFGAWLIEDAARP
ncbi:LysR substrate-binding domain-containing protein [Roseisalinus antarcticus]|uniref:Glycine cleavage system transcriptional activator n=1 Tax=Roseisalinus antarcticus TaxID=254357 RepID=A0A1Y5RX52_9RHOB|nr:LysR substrate-binding domain-containing protein [Roseisalinus antarcticus]SLN27661.1 Glycine cleavage system transcriptional activator [Roseisalinus antarcticus]